MRNVRALVALRKRQFEQAEQALAVVNAELNRLEEEKRKLRAMMRETALPAGGEGRLLGAVTMQRGAIAGALKELEARIAAVRQARQEQERHLKAAHIALEQARSLESEALQRLMRLKMRRERGLMDEIAARKFWLDNGEKEKL